MMIVQALNKCARAMGTNLKNGKYYAASPVPPVAYGLHSTLCSSEVLVAKA